MLEAIKNRLCETLPFYTKDFSDFIEIESVELSNDIVTLTLKKELNIDNFQEKSSVFVQGIKNSWAINLNPSIYSKNGLHLTIETEDIQYIDVVSYKIPYFLEKIFVIADNQSKTVELNGEVELTRAQGFLDENGTPKKRLEFKIKNVLPLFDFIELCQTGYSIQASEGRISFLNLIPNSHKAFNRKLEKADIIQNENKFNISYKVNSQEGTPILEANASINYNHRIYKTGRALENILADNSILLTEHELINGTEVEFAKQNSIYIIENGSQSLANLNTPHGQDGAGSYYTTRQASFTILLLLPTTIMDKANNSLFANDVDKAELYARCIVKEFHGCTLFYYNKRLQNITLQNDTPTPSNNPELFLRAISFQSTMEYFEIAIHETNPMPLAKNIETSGQVNSNKDKYITSTIE